jgi:hypothetical protein
MDQQGRGDAYERAPTGDAAGAVARRPTYGAAAHVRAEALPAPWPAEPGPFRFLAPEYALPAFDDEPTACAHPRATGRTFEYPRRGGGQLLAHQCLNCGEAVSAEEVARRRRHRAGAGAVATWREGPHAAAPV